jgi:NADPH2:quinone reductase
VQAIVVRRAGGPEVLEVASLPEPRPGPGEALVRHVAIGLDFIDVYHRTGLYPVSTPFTPGLEAAGVVEALGPGVDGLAVGERVAYAAPPPGAYQERRAIAAAKLVKLPRGIDERTAAGAMLKGMTAEFLVRRTFRVERGQTVLVHAAAGGVGLLLCQWASHLGARVIGTVGSREKAELAAAHGCAHPVLYREEDFVAAVRALTGGALCEVVYDSVGRDTFLGSLDCLRPRGMLVSFGQSSGSPEPLDVGLLGRKGSLFLTRPSLMAYTATRAELEASAGALFEGLAQGWLRVEIGASWPLAEAAEAHRALEGRRTSGASLLLPG